MIPSSRLSELPDLPQGAIMVDPKDLYSAVKAVKRTEIHTLPAVNHVLIRVTATGLRVATTDLNNFKVKDILFWGRGERWETCAPMVHKKESFNQDSAHVNIGVMRKFYPFIDYLRVMAEEEFIFLQFDPSLQLLTISTETSKATFKCLDAKEFPPIREELIAD